MPEVPQTSAAVWMIQHRSWRRPMPSRSWRPGGTLRCICCIRSNLFLKLLSLTFSIWGPNVYFQWKSQQTICWVHTNILTQTFAEVIRWGWYSPQLRVATFTGWILITVVRCFLSNDSCGYSSVHIYSNILVLQCTFWLVQAHFHLLMQLCYQLFGVITLNTVQVLLLGKIRDWLLHKQRRKMPI